MDSAVRKPVTGRRPTATAAGILRPEVFAEYAQLARHACSAELGVFVENYWGVTWGLPGGAAFLNSTVPHPAAHLSIEWGGVDRAGTRAAADRPGAGGGLVWVTGVPTSRFDVRLSGSGGVVGVKFRPGGLIAMFGGDPAALLDATVPADRVAAGLAALLGDLTMPLDDTVATQLDHRLGGLVGEPPADYLRLLDVIDVALGDRDIIRVEQLAERAGIGTRTLQRLFARYLGVGPKWVLARYRLHDAVDAIDHGYTGSLSELAVRLGWFDQAHFIADFAALVGKTPETYRRGRG